MKFWLRPAQPTDAGRMGDILWDHLRNELGEPELFSAAEAISYCDRMIDFGWVTVALYRQRIGGFIARNGAEIEALYILFDLGRRGVGRLLLKDAKAQSATLRLRVRGDNQNARRFYRRVGFEELQTSVDRPDDERVIEMI